jgi:histidine ammonia-lyase/phenylalanine ammonia-lyase
LDKSPDFLAQSVQQSTLRDNLFFAGEDVSDLLSNTGVHLDLDGNHLTIDDAVSLARHGGRCVLSPEAVRRVQATRALKHDLIAREIPVYGVTTGFGDSAHRQIAPAKAAQLQQNMLRFLGAGTGQYASPEVTRATMLMRANCLAKGNSGVRVELIERLIELLNHDVLPLIPERGSCGASGDLVPLSYVGRTLTGETEVLFEGEVREASEVLASLDLEPLELEAKEGLALTNGTSFMSAFAVLAVADARELAFVSDLCTSMASQALLGNRGHFNAFIFEAKPHPGQIESARVIRQLLEGTDLAKDSDELFHDHDMHGAGFRQLERSVQDKYSIRCAPAVNGMLRDTLEWVERWVSIEINSSDDNPLFDPIAGRVQSGGNFMGSHMGQGMDSLKVALANLCDLMDRQLELVVDEKFNVGLTPNLIPFFSDNDPEAGLHHGFKGMQLSCSALTAEALKLSNPATAHSRSTEAHNQDKVSMGTIAARDARTIVEIAQNVAAIHVIAICQALELRGIEQASPAARRVHALIRTHVPFLSGDRRMDADVAAVVELIRDGALSRAALGG